MEIPLFPLHTVLCPGIVLPLHVFEERYRALTRHCLETRAPFGVVLIRQGNEVGAAGIGGSVGSVGAGRPGGPAGALALAGVGALVEIREAGRYPDGRYDLLAAATGRFVIESVDPGREPYLVADVTPLEDQVGDETRAEQLAASTIRRFVRYLDLMRARDGERSEVLDIRVELDSVADPDDDDGPDDVDGDDTMVDDDDVDDAIVEAITAALIDDAVLPAVDGAEADLFATDRRRELVIPDDPTVLSYLLSGIVQAELPLRQALLEAATTVERLEALTRLLDREIFMLTHRLRLFAPDPGLLGGPRRS